MPVHADILLVKYMISSHHECGLDGDKSFIQLLGCLVQAI